MKFHWQLPLVLVVIAGGATGVTMNKGMRGRVLDVVHRLMQATAHAEEAPPDKSWLKEAADRDRHSPWDRVLRLDNAEIKAIGLRTVAVRPQTDPTALSLFGQTDYVPSTKTVVRTVFDNFRVDEIYVGTGSIVKKGDPLLEIFSTDLAAAKSDYEAAQSQWTRDKKVLENRKPLALENILPRNQLVEIENDEQQSRVKMKLAKDKLLVYGLSLTEIEKAQKEEGVDKARLTLRSPGDGYVVQKAVVKGNYYDAKDTLITIAPLDHLWVRGNVSELDSAKVHVGQSLIVYFPFSDSNREIPSKIDYIDKQIDPETRTTKFRAEIANPEGRIQVGAFVKVRVMIPPKPGHTVVPRSAMVSVDRYDYVFVRKPGKGNQFERRSITTAKEHNDIVIVAAPVEGHRELAADEEVVTTGSLILEQMYEDRIVAEGDLLDTPTGQQRLDRFQAKSTDSPRVAPAHAPGATTPAPAPAPATGSTDSPAASNVAAPASSSH